MHFRGRQYAGTQGRRDAGTQGRRDAGTWARRASVVLLSFALFGSVASAQLLPPVGAIKWNKNGDGDWGTASNWSPAVIPADHEGDMLFGSVSNQGSLSAITVSVTANPYPRSLWFDADSGINYTIDSTGGISIGQGVPNNGTLVAVFSKNGTRVVETNINGEVVFYGNSNNGYITNQSRGGLRFGGNLWFGRRNLIVSGSGAQVACVVRLPASRRRLAPRLT